MHHWIVVGLTAVYFALGFSAASAAVARVKIENSWARATLLHESANGAVFMTLTDTSGKGDMLVAASSPVAKTTELHVHKIVSGVIQMRPVSSLPIPAGGSITLQPGAEHVMLIGLKRPLREGETIPLQLVFTHSNIVETTVQIRGVGFLNSHTGHGDHGSGGTDH